MAEKQCNLIKNGGGNDIGIVSQKTVTGMYACNGASGTLNYVGDLMTLSGNMNISKIPQSTDTYSGDAYAIASLPSGIAPPSAAITLAGAITVYGVPVSIISVVVRPSGAIQCLVPSGVSYQTGMSVRFTGTWLNK